MITTIQKWGNSQGIQIPKFMIEAVNWSGDENLVVRTANDKIIIEKDEKRKGIMELFDGFDGEYVSVEMNWGEPNGEEVW